MIRREAEKLLQKVLDNHYQWVLRGFNGTSTQEQTTEYLQSKEAVVKALTTSKCAP